MTRSEWLASTSDQLDHAGIESARLDSELLLTHVLGIARTALHAHSDITIGHDEQAILDAMVSLRIIRVPVAYIVGHREFYGRLFKVTPSVLIPRPETEDIIDILSELTSDRGEPFKSYIDIGTGSGALALTLALEHPDASVTATDISQDALDVARGNQSTYQTNVIFIEADLLDGIDLTNQQRPLCIVANLPYVGHSDPRSPETEHEPGSALFADDDGLALIKRLIGQSAKVLTAGDCLILESNVSQQPAINAFAIENGFAREQTRRLITVLRRL